MTDGRPYQTARGRAAEGADSRALLTSGQRTTGAACQQKCSVSYADRVIPKIIFFFGILPPFSVCLGFFPFFFPFCFLLFAFTLVCQAVFLFHPCPSPAWYQAFSGSADHCALVFTAPLLL